MSEKSFQMIWQNTTLEEWLSSSPVSEKSSANSETHWFKHFTNRVHPALLDHTESSSNPLSNFSEDKLLKELNGKLTDGFASDSSIFLKPEPKREDEEEGQLQMPEEEEIIIYSPPEGGTRCKRLEGATPLGDII
ncbi:uncharacterized protein J3R85_018525 [Psidium guajava]|nr:uncharacterized protein J3R85_018525 [Psidium guajava]